MLAQTFEHVSTWLRRALASPRTEITRWQGWVRWAYDLAVYGASELWQSRAPQMAAALSFRALFAMLPVLVLGTVLIKAARGPEQFQDLVAWIVDGMELNDVRIVAPEQVTDEQDPKSIALGTWLQDVVGDLAGADLRALGWVGLIIVIYSAIAVMVTIENSFNAIYRAPEGRPWTRRVPLYWFILTVGPVALAMTLVIDNTVAGWIESVHTWGWLIGVAGAIWSFAVAWLFMFAIYKLVPNTVVATKPAVAGALVAAILLEVGRRSLGAYFSGAFSFSYLYGSLGLIPVFMFWMYLMWWVVLFGLEVSVILQTHEGRQMEEMKPKPPPSGFVDPASVLAVMQVISERFAEGKPSSSRQITEGTGIMETLVVQMIERLTKEGLLHRLEGEECAVTLARPPQSISADEVIEIGFQLVDESGVGKRPALLDRLREVQRRLASEVNLALLGPTEAGSGTVAPSPARRSDQAAGA